MLIGKLEFGYFLLLFFFFGITFVTFRKLRCNVLSKIHGKLNGIEGEINLLQENIRQEKESLNILPLKYTQMSFLFQISQKLIEAIDDEDIIKLTISVLEELFPQAESFIFFEFDKEKDAIILVHSLKKYDFYIKEKKGNILDHWVLKHNVSLLVEDITKDFRFDFNKISAYSSRAMNSFIVSPLSIGNKILGVVRVESRKASAFSLNDSRVLRNICDLAAIVFEKMIIFKKLEELAIQDSLTSLFLRDYFFERLKEEIKRMETKKNKSGIIMLDIDGFKNINDTYGHIVGDLVLKKISTILISLVSGKGNIVSRFGGEEFIALIVECDKQSLIAVSEEIRKTIEDSGISFRRKRIKFTVSLGALLFSEANAGITELIDCADKLMYRAKKAGKNKVCFSG